MGDTPMPRVVGVTATYRRPAELDRLIASLEQIPRGFHALVVVDNAGDPRTREAAERARIPTRYLNPGANLGCGGGLAAGERFALEKLGPTWTHLWILDDDTVVAPDALERLLAAMAREGAVVAHPLTTDGAGQLGWFPGLLDREKFRAIRVPGPPEQFITQCGDAPVPFSWSQGIALLVARTALEALGPHRDDYWVRGEDLEFSLRLTHGGRGIYVPAARVQHLPPAAAPSSGDAEYRRHGAMLQNIAYTAARLPHGRRLLRTIPGNWLRFLRMWSPSPRVVADAARALFLGAVRGEPAGVSKYFQR
jgi:GT2 family glycosyltransferase